MREVKFIKLCCLCKNENYQSKEVKILFLQILYLVAPDVFPGEYR